MNILAIETSCDETAAAVVEDGTKVRSSVVASSTKMFEKYGGIVPEVAAREQLKFILPVLTEALAQAHVDYQSIDKLAVTVGPGLIGSLLVGVETAKTIAYVENKPIIPVNHVLAHIYANFVDNAGQISFPSIALVVSGGHTELFLMESEKKLQWLGGTLDDAAGEAFDKTARLLGFGNRGGLAIQEAAAKITNSKTTFHIKLPRPMAKDETLNFSFSGLKTAIMREWNTHNERSDQLIYELSHEVQESITDVLVSKTVLAAQQYHVKSVLIAGGVAANTRLREKFAAHQTEFQIHFPPTSLCTDNAVYIASYAYFRGQPVDWRCVDASPGLPVEVQDSSLL